MMKKRAIVLAVSMLYIVSGISAAAAEVNEEITESTAAGTVEETAEAVDASEEIIEITSAEELAAINDNLSGNYVLTADIDLEGAEWTPLGSFVQQGEEGEEAEMPDLAYAFTGTFDGQGHTISNFTVNQPDAWALGLFGCIANTQIGNFTVENAVVDGTTMAAGVVGYSFCSNVSDITLSGATVTAHASELSEEGMYGGIVAAGMMSTIENCTAQADIIIPDGTANAGIVGGGLELTSVIGCSASGTVTAGNSCYGLGGISGCGFGSEEFTNCSAQDVVITAGDDCFWIGGVTGYAGGYEAEEAGVPITRFTDCTAVNVQINVGANADGVDELVGAGFYYEGLAEAYGADYYAEPTEYVLTDCEAQDVVVSTSEEAENEAASENSAAEEDQGIFPAVAGAEGTTYENFFDVTLAEENYDLWYDCCAAIVGESAAEETVAFMQGYISSDKYGEEAIAYYEENPDAPKVFDCWYISGVKLVTFNPDMTITVELEDGSSETHSYEYQGVCTVGEGETMVYMGEEMDVAFPCDVYASTDEAGEFNYFLLRDDTMEETGHIEFRYGKDLEELKGYFTGPYGYWLTAGFDVAADEETLKNTVQLFCLENMDYSSHADDALAQLSDFIGTWTADFSAYGEEYADVDLTFTIDENGHGVTTMDGEQTADFEAYAFDSGDKGDGEGIYVAYSNLEYEAEAAPYTLETNEAGDTVLTFYASDGVISYVKAA